MCRGWNVLFAPSPSVKDHERMLEPKDMTSFQKFTSGLRIIEGYLSRENPGDICAEHDEIFVHGVNRDALGGDDPVKLEAMGWTWDEDLGCWHRFV
jgi:hypothetical protein